MAIRQQPGSASDASFEIQDIQWPWNDFDLMLSPIPHEPPPPRPPPLGSNDQQAGSATHAAYPSILKGYPAGEPKASEPSRHEINAHSNTAATLGRPIASLVDTSRTISVTLLQIIQTIDERLIRLEKLVDGLRVDHAAGLEKTHQSIATVDKKVNETVGRVNQLFHSVKEVQAQLPIQARR